MEHSADITLSLRHATARLSGVSDTARLDAEILMAHALGLSRLEMLMRQRDLTTPLVFAALVERRANAEPVAYIRGFQEFRDLRLMVSPDVLIPRADSETVIEMALDAFADRASPEHVIDLGTGSGALLLAALSAFPGAQGVGIDASAKALAVAADNAVRLGFVGRSAFHHRSWHDAGWTVDLRRFDLILCNPPYVETAAELAATVARYEPHDALFAGADGLDDYHALIPQLPALLAPGGVAIFEIGSTQAQAVSDLASKSGLSAELRCDLAGNPRALCFSLGINGGRG
jgi:release factor glutamine methyltransferase